MNVKILKFIGLAEVDGFRYDVVSLVFLNGIGIEVEQNLFLSLLFTINSRNIKYNEQKSP